MTRRIMGAVLIGVVVLIVAVVGNLRPHLVPGDAEPAPLAGPPAVGDCVVDPLSFSPNDDAAATPLPGPPVVTYARQQIRPCTGSRYGEVVAVFANPVAAVYSGDADNQVIDDPNRDRCDLLRPGYLGATGQPVLGIWYAVLQAGTSLSRPSIRQETAGQHWLACVVGLETETYDGSLHHALLTGAARNQLGRCLAAGSDVEATGACGRPHDRELLAVGVIGTHAVARATVESTCRQLIRQFTAMPDPTAGGALAAHLIQDTNGAVITTSLIPANSAVGCLIATTTRRMLTGSLLALGDAPIPWS